MLLYIWSSILQGRFHSLNLDIALAIDYSKAGLTLRKYSFRHPHAEIGAFAARPVNMGSASGYY